MSETVQVERRDGWRLVRLNRPDRLNAANAELATALAAAIDAAEDDPACRALVLTGAGRGFCAGVDIGDGGEVDGATSDPGDTLERRYNPLIRRMRALRLPIIAAVNGVAAGAGMSVALACDIVLAGRSARFVQAFVRIGLVPDAGSSYFLPHLIGDARARALALLGEQISAEQAADWGLIWKVLDDAALLPEAEKLAAHLAAQPTATIGLIKRLMDSGASGTLHGQLDMERDLQRQAGRTPDFQEGVQAFREKRPARFTGRPA